MTNNILSVDWDVFFRGPEMLGSTANACSWNCKECIKTDDENARPYIGNEHTEWDAHAVNKVCADPHTLLSPFHYENADLYVAECHADIYSIIGRRDRIVNLDAHPDMWEATGEKLGCGSWGFRRTQNKVGFSA